MKKMVLGILSTAFMVQSVGASVITSRIVDVQLNRTGDKAMVYEESGRILWVKATERKFVKVLKEMKGTNLSLRLDIDASSHNLLGAQLLDQSQLEEANAEEVAAQAAFTPTEMTLSEAKAVFNSMDGATKRNSQCFNRAHGWAYDMFTSKNVNSMKMFIFFTRKYIEDFKYNWWFHVSPYVMVKTEAGVEERVMDRSFSDGPDKLKVWTDYFIKSKETCKVAAKYSDFYKNQWSNHCFLIRANMFYRSPKDLEKLETEGRQELGWNIAEIQEARKQAFKNWRDYNP